MDLRARWFATLALAMALVAPILTTGCSEHHYQVYDPYYHDYHHWNNGEDGYYRRRMLSEDFAHLRKRGILLVAFPPPQPRHDNRYGRRALERLLTF